MTRLIVLLVALLPNALSAQQTKSIKRSIPYFECHVPEHTGVSRLPLQSYSVDSRIAGTIADVNLTQTFINSFNTPLEVTYVFPGSSKSAVYGLTMKIGERIVVAKIQEKYKARETYTEAVQEGKRASLLEQVRPNVFQMTVGNIMPNDTIEVTLQYTEYVESIDGQYQLMIPTTIGERYGGENHGEQSHVTPSYVLSNESPYSVAIQVAIASPVPIAEAKSNTHRIDLNVSDQHHWTTQLSQTEQFAGNRDFILEYRLRGEALASGLLLHEGETENFFMLQIQPPKYVAKEAVPPREYLFVVDVSGSMHGFPMETAKELMFNLLDDLRPNDLFNVLPFAGASDKLFRESQLATTDNIKKAQRYMRSRISGGGTNMASAFRDVYRSMPETPYSRSIILITDGHIEAEQKVFREIRENLNKANVFAFGIGSSVNHFLIEGVARAGMGEEFIVTHAALASEKVNQLANYIKRPALTNIKIDFKDNKVYDFSPISIPDVLSDRPLTIYGKFEGSMTDDIIIFGNTGSDPYHETVNTPNDSSLTNPALRYLWARNKLQDLDDFYENRNELKYEVTNIGLKYHLLTPYTSFVAMDNEVANISPMMASLKQPLALPDNPGYNQNSYRGRMNATGAVSRASGSSEIQAFLPVQSEVSGPISLLRWQNNGTPSNMYTVVIEDIYNNELVREEVFEEYYWINYEAFNAPMGYYLIKIHARDEASSEIGIKHLNTNVSAFNKLFDLNIKYPIDEYLSAIDSLYQSGMNVDAITLTEITIMHYPDSLEIIEIRERIWVELGLY
ncbi:VIT and vWA domain-containing protein [Marinoscillum pacificum]|uniref:VIT and vWA domain-containing protein n=1 Tax=Marinoscillum pacificum TaxID=392723 RepID=UPI0021572B81|nr:VIT and VWA domain-containing protein [Marinoscillum pacificum]